MTLCIQIHHAVVSSAFGSKGWPFLPQCRDSKPWAGRSSIAGWLFLKGMYRIATVYWICIQLHMWCVIIWCYDILGIFQLRVNWSSNVLSFNGHSIVCTPKPLRRISPYICVSTAFPSNRLGVQLALLGHCELHALECFCEPFSWRPGDPVRSAHEAEKQWSVHTLILSEAYIISHHIMSCHVLGLIYTCNWISNSKY